MTSAGGNAYTYDDVGNQRTRPGATITYTAFDLPRTFTLDQGGVVTLDYDGNQRRIRKTTPEQQTVYVGDLYERVTDLLTGAVEHRYYVHGAERAVAMVRPEAASPGPSEAPDSGAAVVPQDADTWGNNAGWLPQPSATAQELPRQNSVGAEVYIGVAQGNWR